jgi:hypothetical protein
MTEAAGRQRAAGYICVHDVQADAQGLFFGRCGTDPSDIDYRVTICERGSPSRRLRLRAHGDFTRLLQSGIFSDLGVRPLSVQMQANETRFSADFEPDATHGANALFRTSNGLRGSVVEVQSSELAAAVVVIVALAATAAWVTVAVGAEIYIHTQATTDSGSADADVQVTAHDDEGGDDGQDGGGGGTGNGP